MEKCLRALKMMDLEEAVSENLEMDINDIRDYIRQRKVPVSRGNVVEVVLHKLKENKWSTGDILNAAFNIELTFIAKYHSRFTWTAHKFVGDSAKDEVSDLQTRIRQAIRSENKDALVITKPLDGLFWISIVMKNLQRIGLYKKPFYIALSESGKHFFTKKTDEDDMGRILGRALGFEKYKPIKLSGRHIQSLIKLLKRSETVDMENRPIFQGGEAVENEYGVDMTQKKSYDDYYMQCVDNDEDTLIEEYKITARKCPWMGPDMPQLKGMQMDASITFSGNVGRIMKALPTASMIKPPFPSFFVNFSVMGKNRVRVVGFNPISSPSGDPMNQQIL